MNNDVEVETSKSLFDTVTNEEELFDHIENTNPNDVFYSNSRRDELSKSSSISYSASTDDWKINNYPIFLQMSLFRMTPLSRIMIPCLVVIIKDIKERKQFIIFIKCICFGKFKKSKNTSIEKNTKDRKE